MTSNSVFISSFKHSWIIFQSTICPENIGLAKLYIVTYTYNGLEDLCFSVIGICCASCLEFRVLIPDLQKLGLFLLFFILDFNLTWKISRS